MNVSRAGLGVRASVALLLAACGGGGSTEPSTGSLALEVTGLPTGLDGNVAVTGPGGFNRSVGRTETLSALAPGSYSITATSVAAGDAQYLPAPASQPVTVSAGETASAGVAYSEAERSLAITVAGLPAGMDAAITVSGPGGYSHQVTASETLTGLAAGQYTVTALPVTDGSDQYTPSPSTRTVTVTTTAAATVTYSTGSTAGFNLRVDGVYLVQSVQTYDRAVPLVRDRDALLRVFVTANQVNAAMPDVDVTLYAGGVAIAELTIPAPGISTPLSPDEATLNNSWNVILDKSLIRSNLSITATVDAANAIAEGDESDNVFPASGTPLPLDVRTVPPFDVTFVPVITRANGRRGDVTDANHPEYLEPTMRMHPLESWDATVHAAYTTTTSLALQSDNGNNAWGTILSEINSLRLAESSMRHYYGVVNPNYSSGVAGVGYIGGAPAALGWDKRGSRGSVAAHEWGHNWGRAHAPCGGAANPDANYPYANGEIGVIGYDVVNETLKPADSHRPHGLLRQRMDQRLHLPRRPELARQRLPRCERPMVRSSRACWSGDESRTAGPCSSRRCGSPRGRACRRRAGPLPAGGSGGRREPALRSRASRRSRSRMTRGARSTSPSWCRCARSAATRLASLASRGSGRSAPRAGTGVVRGCRRCR